MSFEIFQKSNRFAFDDKQVAIQSDGTIAIGPQIVEQYMISCESVLLLWEKNSRLVGLKPMVEKNKNGYVLTKSSSNSGVMYVKAKAFIKHIGALGISKHFKIYWNEEMKHLEFHLELDDSNNSTPTPTST